MWNSQDLSLHPGLKFSSINEGSRKRKLLDNYDNAGHTLSAKVQGLLSSPHQRVGLVAIRALKSWNIKDPGLHSQVLRTLCWKQADLLRLSQSEPTSSTFQRLFMPSEKLTEAAGKGRKKNMPYVVICVLFCAAFNDQGQCYTSSRSCDVWDSSDKVQVHNGSDKE